MYLVSNLSQAPGWGFGREREQLTTGPIRICQRSAQRGVLRPWARRHAWCCHARSLPDEAHARRLPVEYCDTKPSGVPLNASSLPPPCASPARHAPLDSSSVLTRGLCERATLFVAELPLAVSLCGLGTELREKGVDVRKQMLVQVSQEGLGRSGGGGRGNGWTLVATPDSYGRCGWRR